VFCHLTLSQRLSNLEFPPSKTTKVNTIQNRTMTSPSTKPNRLFSLPLELFEEITTFLDYHTLKSLASTNHLARRHLIRKRTLQTALLALELHDGRLEKILSSENLIPCYECPGVLLGESALQR
jgi:hypothetical protein